MPMVDGLKIRKKERKKERKENYVDGRRVERKKDMFMEKDLIGFFV